jgi:hypothetical protein
MATSFTLQNDPALPQGYLKVDGSTSATFTTSGITGSSLTDSSVTASKLANNSVTASKLGTTEQKQIAKAWVNFNGTTSPGTIRSSYNVSSVTKNGTGDYTVNFATAMADANYSWAAAHNYLSDNAVDCGGRQAPTTTTLRTKITNLTTTIDPQWANIIVFSN